MNPVRTSRVNRLADTLPPKEPHYMSLRLLKLPDDLLNMAEMVKETWHYPNNEEWNVQTDEIESMSDSMENYSRIWPLIKLVQLVSPGLRNIMRGHVWEEEGQMAGITQIAQVGTTGTWEISAVGVRPAYRRRGIARKLVEATLDFIRQQGGKKVYLDVIEGNLPAFTLYQKLGFEHYTDSIEFSADLEAIPSEPSLPEGYVQEHADPFDWKPRYELEQRITPERVRQYEPVEEARFRRPFLTRFLRPIVLSADGAGTESYFIRTAAERQIVARGAYVYRTRETGRNILLAELDPAHSQLGDYLVGQMLHQVMTRSPGHVAEFNIPQWMESLVTAAREAGFEQRVLLNRMGILL